MARPRLPRSLRRTRQINARFTEAEAEALAASADAARLTVPEYLRRRGLRRRTPVIAAPELPPEIRFELNKIGVNLNQLVRLAHQGRYRPRGGRAVVERMERMAAWIEEALDPGGGK